MSLSLLLLLFLSRLFHRTFSKSDLGIGTRISVSLPSDYEPEFRGRAFVMESGEAAPEFKAAVKAEAKEGRYVCSLSVLLGEVEVWSSGRFFGTGKCILELRRDGVLEMTDSTGRLGWKTETGLHGVEMLQLLRTGNLVLVDARSQIIWQSFDFPSNIMLWQQRLTVPAQLTSISANSTSFFSFSIQQDKIAMYLNSGMQNYSYWEFKPRKDRKISFIRLGSFGLKLFDLRSRKIAQISSNHTQPTRFLALGPDGNLQFYYYSTQKGKFEASFQALNATCDLPLPCGPYGICTLSNNCRCMQFSRRHNHGNSDCHEALPDRFCGSKDAVQMVELAGLSSVLEGNLQKTNVSKDECVRWCMEDCSCAAVLFFDRTQQECFRYELVGGVKQVVGEVGVNYLVKVPDKMIGGRTGSSSTVKKWLLVCGGAIDGLAILLMLGGLIWYFVLRKRKNLHNENT